MVVSLRSLDGSLWRTRLKSRTCGASRRGDRLHRQRPAEAWERLRPPAGADGQRDEPSPGDGDAPDKRYEKDAATAPADAKMPRPGDLISAAASAASFSAVSLGRASGLTVFASKCQRPFVFHDVVLSMCSNANGVLLRYCCHRARSHDSEHSFQP